MDKVLHKHHIVPRHMGGSDDASNIVELTIEEHAEAHRRLYEQYSRKEDYLAWKGLAGLIDKDELIREKMSLNSSRPGKQNPFYGMKHTQETKQKISEKNKGHSYNKGIPKSEKHKKAISEMRHKVSAKYNFEHSELGRFFGSTGDLGRSFDIRTSEVYKLVKGEYKSYKGWKVVDL